MKCVDKMVLLICLLLVNISFGQSTSEKLKKEQQQLEKNIANTKQLLTKTKSDAANSLNELQLLNNQIAYREQLLRNYDNQIRGAELKIKEKQQQIEELSAEIVKLKEQYKKLLLYAYKNRNKYGKMMYIFSSKSYFEAVKRAKYLEKIQDLIKKQFLVIEQHQKLIKVEMENIEKERQYKAQLLEEKKAEREQIAKDQEKQQQIYNQLKAQEGTILEKLREEEKKRANLKAQIDAAIRKEVAAAEEKRKKAEAEAKKKAEQNKTSTKAPSTTTPKTPSTTEENKGTSAPIVLPETKENALLSKNFEGNKGKLPWPVDKGTISEGFGQNPHPTVPGLMTKNNGIDISTAKNAQVRVVFEGEVTSVLSIPGAGKVVIVKHGDYRTVYSNLASTFVNVGSKVTTKQVIGSLLGGDGQALSICHFEVHQVIGGSVSTLNPSLWLAK